MGGLRTARLVSPPRAPEHPQGTGWGLIGQGEAETPQLVLSHGVPEQPWV